MYLGLCVKFLYVCASTLRLEHKAELSSGVWISWGAVGVSHFEWYQSFTCSNKGNLPASIFMCRNLWGTSPLRQSPSYHSLSPAHKAWGKGLGGLVCNEYRNEYRDPNTNLSPDLGTGYTHIWCGHMHTCSHMNTQGHSQTCAGKGWEQGITNSRSHPLPSSLRGPPLPHYLLFC